MGVRFGTSAGHPPPVVLLWACGLGRGPSSVAVAYPYWLLLLEISASDAHAPVLLSRSA